MEATLEFYRLLGLRIPDEAIWTTDSGAHHVEVNMANGFDLSFDSAELASSYNGGWREPTGEGSRSVLSFRMASRNDVDRIHGQLHAAGYASLQDPHDAFWGSRYAIVADPDGNHVGLMSPPDAAHRGRPPEL